MILRTSGLILVMVCGVCAAQEPAPSVADAAKMSNAGKPKAKIVVTEETLKSRRGPFPDIEFEEEMNTEKIVSAIRDYRSTHTPEETEKALKEWFRYFDEMMLRLIRENNEISQRKQDRYYDPDRYSSDYRLAREQANHDVRSEEIDRRVSLKNGIMSGRIQQTLIQVRGEIARYGMKYEWWKVHYGNGIGTY